MKRILAVLLMVTLLISCGSKKAAEESGEPLVAEKEKLSQQDDNHIFYDESISSFEILSKSGESGIDYKSVEISYKVVLLALPGQKELDYYLAKYTTTSKSCTACEGQERNINVELSLLDNPEQTILRINKNCDLLELNAKTYQTTIWGCCGAENEIELFDYEHRSIVRGHSRIIVGDIPSSPKMNFYLGYVNNYSSPSCLGELVFSYGGTDKYTLSIESNRKKDCTPFSPTIEIIEEGTDNETTVYDDKYTFWSLNKIERKEQINGLVVKLTFDCDETGNNNILEIPIVNGKPFGKEPRQQTISFEAK